MRNPRSFPINTHAGIAKTIALPPYELPNDYDVCLADERVFWDSEISHGRLRMICCPRGRRPYVNRPWVAMPAEGRRFKPIGVLNVPNLGNPANLNVEFVVMSAFVPLAYDGVITDMVCELTAPPGQSTGFTEGSGDVTWRLKADKRHLRDMGNIQTTLGSLTTPNSVPRGGLRVYSRNLLEFVVVFSAGAAVDINPSANVVCSITGWFWPR